MGYQQAEKADVRIKNHKPLSLISLFILFIILLRGST